MFLTKQNYPFCPLYALEDNTEYLELEEVIYAWNSWINDPTPTPDPRYYDSVNECAISDFNSQSEEDSDSDEPPRLIKLPVRQ